jgi:hypothetical protein
MNLPGANTAETNVFMHSRTAAMRHGGMSKGKNHRAREGKERIRAKSALKPAFPPTSRVEISPAAVGPGEHHWEHDNSIELRNRLVSQKVGSNNQQSAKPRNRVR